MAMDTGSGAATEVARPRFPSGAAVAALYAAVLGLLALGATNIYATMNAGFSKAITLNSGIGPYSGKELFMLGTWAISWVVLHFALRHREVNVRRWFGAFLVLLLVATLLVWPPIFEAIAKL